jgi:predicted amidohydrolase YtcJ
MRPSVLLVTNGIIHTGDPALPRAEALVIRQGRLAYVGSADNAADCAQALSSADRGCYETLDLRGAYVLPGLTDAHMHLDWYALGLEQVQAGTDTLDACLQRVEARVQRTRAVGSAGDWITGLGWDHNLWRGGFPTRHLLDRVAPANPVALVAKSGHATWVNSLALKRAGITRQTPDPADGRIMRDAEGEPTGILLEGAAALVRRIQPEPTVEELTDAIRRALPAIHRLGLTGVHDMGGSDNLRALQRLRAEGTLTLRILKSIPLQNLKAAIQLGLESGLGDAMLRLGHVKMFADGALGPRTAWMLQGYDDAPDDHGVTTMMPDEIRDAVQQAANHGLAVAIHAIGDRANREVLDALGELEPSRRCLSLPHRIEHAQLLHPDDIPRLAALGVSASMQPIHATSDMEIAEEHWGERCRGAYAWRSLLRAGVHLAFGSDAPVESLDPLAGIHAAVTRRRPDGSPGPNGWRPQERLTLDEAIAGYTQGPALAAGMEHQLGALTTGRLADLTILDRDLAAIEPQGILQAKVIATMVAGEMLWNSGL